MDDAVKNKKGIKVYTKKEAETLLHMDGDFDFIIDTDGTCGIGKEAVVDYAGNICVIKCSPGLAGAACATIDAMNVHEVVGTIAGDDTIMLVLREGCTRTNVLNALSLIIPNIK